MGGSVIILEVYHNFAKFKATRYFKDGAFLSLVKGVESIPSFSRYTMKITWASQQTIGQGRRACFSFHRQIFICSRERFGRGNDEMKLQKQIELTLDEIRVDGIGRDGKKTRR